MPGFSSMIRYCENRQRFNQHEKFLQSEQKKKLKMQIANAKRFAEEATDEIDRKYQLDRMVDLQNQLKTI
jgi:hypothetical protein